MSERTQTARQIVLSTDLGEDVLLFRRATISDFLGRPFQMEVDVISENGDIDFSQIVGHAAAIRLDQGDGNQRFYNGFITRFIHTGGSDRAAHYRMTISPWIWFLTRTSDCRVFQNMTAPDIIKQVFRDRGFSENFSDALKGSYNQRIYTVQYRETDFNFVHRLMEEEGIYYYWEHTAEGHKLVLADGYASHEAYPGYDTIPYYPPTDEDREEEYIWEWIVEQEVQPGIYVHTDYDFEQPRQLLTQAQIIRDHAMPNFELFDYPGGFDSKIDGEPIAKKRIEEWQANHEIIRGEGDARGLAVGYTFTLSEFPRESQNKEHLITSAIYELESDDYNSTQDGDSDAPVYTVSFTALLATTQFRLRRVTPKPVVHGLQSAIVTGPDGEEIHTDQYGRVKVMFYWDRDGKGDDTTSCWVRVAQIWAGKKWGAMFIPRVGQEVLIDFMEGDPDKPVVIGRMYNGTQKVPYDLPANKTVSTIKSDSSKGSNGFNELRFEDKKGSEQVMIHAQHRMDVRVRSSLYETAGGNREEHVGYEDKGDHNIFVCGDTNHHVKGGYYIKVEKKLNECIVDEVVEDYQAKHTSSVKERATYNAKEIVIEAQQTLSMKADKLIGQGASLLSLKAGSVHIEGTQEICLKVGGNFVTIDCSGVSIKGTMVMINSGGAAQSADAPLTMEDPTIEDPLDAAEATTALPGEMHGGGGPRTRNRRTITLNRAPEPPPPAPPGTCGWGTTPTPNAQPQDEIELIEVMELKDGNYQAVQTRKQYVNLDPDTSKIEQGRTINLRAKIKWKTGDPSRSLAGNTVRWYFTPGGSNRASLSPASCKAGYDSEGGAAHKDTTTDDQGYAYADFVVSQYGGDTFQPFATLDAGYTGGISGGNYTVWRKLFYEVDCMGRVNSGTYADRANTASMESKFATQFLEVVKTGTDGSPAWQRVLTNSECGAWVTAVRDGSGSPRYFHLVLVDTITVPKTGAASATKNVTLRKGTDRTIVISGDTIDPRNWFISCTWTDGGSNSGNLALDKFSAVRDASAYPSSDQAVDVDLSSLGVPNGTNIQITLTYIPLTALSGLQTGPATILGMRWREAVFSGGDITTSTLNTMMHEPGHAMGLASTTLPDGTACATTYFKAGHHCNNHSNTCIMYEANSLHTDPCEKCADALRGRKLTSLPISGNAAFA